MPRTAPLPLTLPPLSPVEGEPLHRRLYLALREMILDGRLPSGSRLPASRDLAGQMGLSRSTVVIAFEHLAAEGFVEARHGSGTRVAAASLATATMPESATPRPPRLGERARTLMAGPAMTSVRDPGRPFAPGVPDLGAFPHSDWQRCLGRVWRGNPRDLMAAIDPLGHAPLRRAITLHVGRSRAVRCDPEQILVVGGSQQGLDLIARVLLNPNDVALVEDPYYGGMIAVLRAAGARVAPIPVDASGFDPDRAVRQWPEARLACVTPSHQFPTGATMPLTRRMALLDWAAANEGWIVEDDYDGDFRYGGAPLASLQGLDRHDRTLYCGTFSKSMFPGLRLGWLVVPKELVPAFVAARRLSDMAPSIIPQAAMAEFMAAGYYGAHLRRMRGLYAQRRTELLAALTKPGPWLSASAGEAGLHAIVWLKPGCDDREAAASALAHGLGPTPLSAHRASPGPPGLILGYGNMAGWSVADAVARLHAALTTRTG